MSKSEAAWPLCSLLHGSSEWSVLNRTPEWDDLKCRWNQRGEKDEWIISESSEKVVIFPVSGFVFKRQLCLHYLRDFRHLETVFCKYVCMVWYCMQLSRYWKCAYRFYSFFFLSSNVQNKKSQFIGLHVGSNNCTVQRPVASIISVTTDSTTFNLSDVNRKCCTVAMFVIERSWYRIMPSIPNFTRVSNDFFFLYFITVKSKASFRSRVAGLLFF